MTIEELKTAADQIKNETQAGANTAERVGTILEDIIDAVDKKIDKVFGKGLSTNDYTNAEKAKVAKVNSMLSVESVTDEKVSLSYNPSGTGFYSKADSDRIFATKESVTQVGSDVSTLDNQVKELAGFKTTISSGGTIATLAANKITIVNDAISTLRINSFGNSTITDTKDGATINSIPVYIIKFTTATNGCSIILPDDNCKLYPDGFEAEGNTSYELCIMDNVGYINKL